MIYQEKTENLLQQAKSARDNGDYAYAFELFKSLAEQGNAEAQFNLGMMYANRQGVEQNYHQAITLFQLAADQGMVEAQFNLGIAYKDGKGVRQDLSLAKEWFGRACDNGLQKGCEAYRLLNESTY